MSCGVSKDKVDNTDPQTLLNNLLGDWDPVALTYTKLKHVINLMEAGIGLGGGPVHGINFTQRCRQISKELETCLGGKPSEDIMFASVLALYRIKKHVVKIINDADPQTGVCIIIVCFTHGLHYTHPHHLTGGGNPSPQIQCLEVLVAQLNCFVRNHEEHEMQKAHAQEAK